MIDSLEQLQANWAAEEARQKAEVVTQLRAVIEQLLPIGVTTVSVDYDGSGDSGQIAEIEFQPEGLSIPEALVQQLRDVCYQLCPPGFENNEGGFGCFVIDVVTGNVEHEHNDYFSSVHTTHDEFQL